MDHKTLFPILEMGFLFDLFYIKNLAAAERYKYEPMLIFWNSLARKENERKHDPILLFGKGTVTAFRLGGQNRYDAFSFHVLPQPVHGFRKVIDMVISTLESTTYHF
jgi:hypothetical protein